jgi:hypothetical protein
MSTGPALMPASALTGAAGADTFVGATADADWDDAAGDAAGSATGIAREAARSSIVASVIALCEFRTIAIGFTPLDERRSGCTCYAGRVPVP